MLFINILPFVCLAAGTAIRQSAQVRPGDILAHLGAIGHPIEWQQNGDAKVATFDYEDWAKWEQEVIASGNATIVPREQKRANTAVDCYRSGSWATLLALGNNIVDSTRSQFAYNVANTMQVAAYRGINEAGDKMSVIYAYMCDEVAARASASIPNLKDQAAQAMWSILDHCVGEHADSRGGDAILLVDPYKKRDGLVERDVGWFYFRVDPQTDNCNC